MGRTVQDAVPMSMGDEFGGLCQPARVGRLEDAKQTDRQRINMGATAIGTAINLRADWLRPHNW